MNPQKNICKFIMVSLLMICEAFSAPLAPVADLDADQLKQKEEYRDAAMATILFMNHINYVVHTLSTYQNVYVIEEEYEKLANGLNLSRIPDEKIREAIADMLDKINSMRVAESYRKRFMRAQESRAEAAKEKMWKDMLSSFFVDGLPAGKDSYEHTVETMGKNATKKAMSLALACNVPLAIGKACAGQVIGSYLTYQKTLGELQSQSEEYQFNFDMGKMKELHGMNKDQLNLQYGLIKKYSIEDQDYRVTELNVKEFIDCIKVTGEGMEVGVLTRLKSMLNRKRSFQHFPMFWNYYSAFALKSKEYEEVIVAAENFERENRNSLFREESDPMAAQVAMNKITALVGLKRIETDTIRKALDVIKRYNYSSRSIDMDYFCATIYSSVLKDPQSAIDVLRPLIFSLEQRYDNQLVEYRDLLKRQTEENGLVDFEVPTTMDLFRCHKLMKDILSETKSESYLKVLEQICARSTTASLEKLYLMGETRVSDLWKLAKSDVKAMRLQYVVKPWASNVFEFYVPLQWFALGEMSVEMSLQSGTNCIEKIHEDHIARRITQVMESSDRLFVKIELPCRQKKMKLIDNVIVHLPHVSWPIDIEFYPGQGMDILEGDFSGDQTQFHAVGVCFMGKSMTLFDDIENERSLSRFDDSHKEESYSNNLSRNLRSWKFWFYPSYSSLFLIGGSDPNKVRVKFKSLETWMTEKMLEKAKDKKCISCVIPYPLEETAIGTNSVVGIVASNMNFVVGYTNVVPYRSKLKVDITAFNPFGAQYVAMDQDITLEPLSGGTMIFEMPEELKDCQNPCFLMLDIKKERGLEEKVWDRWSRYWDGGKKR